MKVEVNVEAFKKFMEEKQKIIEKQLPESVKNATLEIQKQVKESIARGTNAPVAVDTGLFLSSVDFEVTGQNQAKVFTDLEYAKFIEYGTSKMKARPHFRNTVFVIQDGIKETFGIEINEAIEK